MTNLTTYIRLGPVYLTQIAKYPHYTYFFCRVKAHFGIFHVCVKVMPNSVISRIALVGHRRRAPKQLIDTPLVASSHSGTSRVHEFIEGAFARESAPLHWINLALKASAACPAQLGTVAL